MLEGIIALVVIGTIGYFMWQKSKKSTESEAEPSAPYKIETPAPTETVAATSPVIEQQVDVEKTKPKAKKVSAPKKPKAEKAKTEGKSKAVVKKPRISVAK